MAHFSKRKAAAVGALLVVLAVRGSAHAVTATLTQTYVNPGPGVADFLGRSVATLGTNVITGVPNDDTGATDTGAVYLFDGATGAVLRILQNPTPEGGDGFGAVVAAVGAHILVGAPFDDTDATDAGMAYLFDGNSASATYGQLLATIHNPTPSAGDRFGSAVAGIGLNALVGAPFDDSGAVDAGAAYLFDANPSSMSFGALLQTIQKAVPVAGDQLGASVQDAALGRYVIGIPGDDTGASNAGAVLYYDGATASIIGNPEPNANDQFGFSLGFLDRTTGSDLFIVGAPFDDHYDGSVPDAGAAYTFFASTGAHSRTYRKFPPEAGALLGYSVAGYNNGQILAIGALFDDAGASNGGAVHLWDTSGNKLGVFTKTGAMSVDNFGIAVAAVGTTVYVGTIGDDAGVINAGAVYSFDGNYGGGGFGTQLQAYIKPTLEENAFGSGVAVMGQNLVIVAPNVEEAYLIDGSTAELLRIFQNPNPAQFNAFGTGVAVIGDTVAIGAMTNAAPGAIFLFDADPASDDFGGLIHTFYNPAPASDDAFGAGLGALGTKLIAGDARNDTGAVDAGIVYVFDADTTSGTFGNLLLTIPNPTPALQDNFGLVFAAVGNNLLVGAPYVDIGSWNQVGEAYLFDGTSGALLRTFNNPAPTNGNDEFGCAVAAYGSDVLIGARLEFAQRGKVYLMSGATGAVLKTFQDPDATGLENFGSSVTAVGTNVLIGAPGNTKPGQAHYFVSGDPAKRLEISDPENPNPPWMSNLAHGVAAIGADGIVAHYLADLQGTDSGAVYRYSFTFVCGDAMVDPGEQCDDGNTSNGDCCSATCTYELTSQTCNDASVCTTADHCDGSGHCVGTPLNCSDGKECTDDNCNPSSGCFWTNRTGACTDDGNSCTTDVCSSGNCTHPTKANGSSCTDNNNCTTPDLCNAGVCVPGACQVLSPCGVFCGAQLLCQQPAPGQCVCQ